MRRRLDDAVRALTGAHRVVVVAATAGAGKTTAVASATAALDRPRSWLSVDRTDSAPGRLVTYLEAAIAQTLPQVSGIATQALTAQLPHPEAAGLLAEAVGDTPLVMVLDDLERLGRSAEAWAVVEAFVRYAPASVSTVLLSRRSIPLDLCELPPAPLTAGLGEAELAFTVEEATQALAHSGSHSGAADAAAAVDATGGWVTGVLFRAHGTEADAPRGAWSIGEYLSAQVIAQLPDASQALLVQTALLEEVDPAAAEALGVPDAAARIAALRAEHLPVTWDRGGTRFRAHPLFREHLLELLHRRPAAELRELQIARARLLAEHGHDEEAVEQLLEAGAIEQALAPAERSIIRVVERLDIAVAERWLSRLKPVLPSEASELHTAELLLHASQWHYRSGAAVGDRLEAAGERDRAVRRSQRTAALLAWAYGGAGRYEDMRAVLEIADDGPEVRALRYTDRLIEPVSDEPRPELTGAPTDALVFAADHGLGRFAELATPSKTRWVRSVAAPWRVAALRATGRTEEALALYDEVRRTHNPEIGRYMGLAGAELFTDARMREEAAAALAEGRRFLEHNGAHWEWMLSWVVEARMLLRLDRDADAALAVLAVADRELGDAPIAMAREACDAWSGYALLLKSEDDQALARLRRCVDSMLRGDRLADLPHAAVYLAEAEWRAGDEERADRAAALGLAASRRIGSNFLVLQALADFPAVAVRCIDGQAGTDSEWHAVGRALVAMGAPLDISTPAGIVFEDLGRPSLVVDGEHRRPRIVKALELLAFLLQRPGRHATRDELLNALFDGRDDRSTRAYLRQAIGQLTRALPDPLLLTSEDGLVTLDERMHVDARSVRAVRRLEEARAREGEAALRAAREAVDLLDAGAYLEGATTSWVDEHRRTLSGLANDARYHAARAAVACDRLLEAITMLEPLVAVDPLREDAWRLLIEVKGALGDEPGVLAAFRDCTTALAALGTQPAPSTRELVDRLRR